MGSTGFWFLATDPVVVDSRGLKCPLPVLKMEKRLAQRSGGGQLVVLATDPMARIDIPLYCHQNGLNVVFEERDGELRFTIDF